MGSLAGIFKQCYCTYKISLGRILILQRASPKWLKELGFKKGRTQEFHLLSRAEIKQFICDIVELINTTLTMTLYFLWNVKMQDLSCCKETMSVSSCP